MTIMSKTRERGSGKRMAYTSGKPMGIGLAVILVSLVFACGSCIAAPDATALDLSMPLQASQGDEISISATITDAGGNPLQEMSIEFYRDTTFGKLKIGEALTGPNGEASISHSITYHPYNGSCGFSADFAGTSDFEANTVTQYVSFGAQEAVPTAPDHGYGEILSAIVFFTIIAWAAFGFIIYILIKIYKDGKVLQTSTRDMREDQ